MSYLKGATDESLQNLTIGQLLEQSVNRYASQTAILYYNGQRLTYAEVFEKVWEKSLYVKTMKLHRNFAQVFWYLIQH